MAGTLGLELRNDRRHPPYDLPVDHIELALCLAPCLLHAKELRAAIGDRHYVSLPCQSMKLDGPP